MKAATPETSALTYVIGCLYFCSETLSALGRKDCADELRNISEKLAGSLERRQGCKLKVVVSNG